MKAPPKSNATAKPHEQATPNNEREIQKILKSGQVLLEKIQEMNPNSAKHSLKTEMCEAEFRDVLQLDPHNVAAVVGLSELFKEDYDEGASQEAISLLDEALKHAPKNKKLMACKKSHDGILKELESEA